MDRKIRQTRSLQTELKTRAELDAQDMYIEGYFAVFGRETELWPGAFEEIAPGAFDETLNNDIRALINHDTTLVLGRNKANTLELKTDNYGLWAGSKSTLTIPTLLIFTNGEARGCRPMFLWF